MPCPAPSPTTVQLTSSATTPGNLQSLLLHYTWQCSGTSQCHVHLCRLHIQYTHTYTMCICRHVHIYDLIFVSILIWKQVWERNSIYLLFLCTYLWNHNVFHLKLLIAVNNYSNNLFTSKHTYNFSFDFFRINNCRCYIFCLARHKCKLMCKGIYLSSINSISTVFLMFKYIVKCSNEFNNKLK